MALPLPQVVFLGDDSTEAETAWEWLRGRCDDALRVTTLAGAVEAIAARPEAVVWAHAAAPLDAAPEAVSLLQRGRAVLALGAAGLPAQLGVEPTAPEAITNGTWRDAEDELFLFKSFTEFPHIRGHAPCRHHRLFADLGNGTYTWWPTEGEIFCRVTYLRPNWPSGGRVLAVERSYIHINDRRATIWAYPNGVLCIGAHFQFAAPAPEFRERLHRLTENAFMLLAGTLPEGNSPDRFWERILTGAVEDESLPLPRKEDQQIASAALRPRDDTGKGSRPREDGGGNPQLRDDRSRLELAGLDLADRPFTLAGRRVLAAGTEEAGLEEVWVHPLRVMKSVRIADMRAERVSARPALLTRTLVGAAGARLEERVWVADDEALFGLEWRADSTADLAITWIVDLRLMWPYPAFVTGPLSWRRDDRSLTVRGVGPHDAISFAWSRPPDAWQVEDASTAEASAIAVTARFLLQPEEAIRILAGSAVESLDSASVGAAITRRATRITDRHDLGIRVTTPEPEADAAVEWATYRLGSFLVETPDLGASVVAGYWRSGPGWYDGRPGYAWYFGRDAVWTALGALAAGLPELARSTLRFLGRHQDLTGKILHECTTSGAVHYDAADSTPLYLLLAARYAAWTGDLATLREELPRILDAYRFCLATDTDGDGLIENTRQGHGWIEFGPLGGGTVTHYNAAIWTSALHELASVAAALGEIELSRDLVRRHRRARRALEATFYDPSKGEYALNISREGDKGEKVGKGDWTQTALQAVPLLLGVAKPSRSARWLNRVASEAFTAPWGVRMIPRDDPAYEPTSYHGGAVWPLYTGWVSWAEYTAGRAEAGAAHWRQNVALGFARERGAWDEVLHGDEFRAAGVCPDQAWSTAMVVSPLVSGMLGVVPSAHRRRIRVRPQLPPEWDSISVKGLRVADAELSFRYERASGRHRFAFRVERGAPALKLRLEPALLLPGIGDVRLDGEAVPFTTRRFGDRALLSVTCPLQPGATRTLDVREVEHR